MPVLFSLLSISKKFPSSSGFILQLNVFSSLPSPLREMVNRLFLKVLGHMENIIRPFTMFLRSYPFTEG